jgi:Rrf2 family protein
MLSTTADHAIRALLVLARSRGRRFMRADEIAAAVGSPQNYMAKTLNALAKARIVTSERGPAGGFKLAVEPESLTLARVIDLFDSPRQQSRCLLGSVPCNPLRPCAAHECWTSVMRAQRAPLITTTIADLADTVASHAPVAQDCVATDEFSAVA